MADGTRAPAGVGPAAVVDAVAAYLVAEGTVTEQSFERLVELMERFAAFVSAGHGVGDLRAADRAMVDELSTLRLRRGLDRRRPFGTCGVVRCGCCSGSAGSSASSRRTRRWISGCRRADRPPPAR